MIRKIGVVLIVISFLMVVAASMASAATYIYVSGNGFTCSRTQPEYMINAGGSSLKVQPDSYKFNVYRADAPGYSGMSAPYITAGYNAYRNSSLCNNRNYRGYYLSRSYALPVKLGKQGQPAGNVHDLISSNFSGDSGFDLWLTASAGEHSYAQMVNGGSGTTEIMLWLQHRGVPTSGSYNISIDGRKWGITVGLASHGHGVKPGRKGWNVVNFIAPSGSRSNVTFNHLHLNAFIGYAISHGWLRSSDYLMSVNQGFEITHGTATVAGYSLSGLPH